MLDAFWVKEFNIPIKNTAAIKEKHVPAALDNSGRKSAIADFIIYQIPCANVSSSSGIYGCAASGAAGAVNSMAETGTIKIHKTIIRSIHFFILPPKSHSIVPVILQIQE